MNDPLLLPCFSLVANTIAGWLTPKIPYPMKSSQIVVNMVPGSHPYRSEFVGAAPSHSLDFEAYQLNSKLNTKTLSCNNSHFEVK